MIRSSIRAAVRFVRSLGRRQRSLQERFPQFEIGVGSYGSPKVVRFRPTDRLSIGKYCSIAPEVHILLGGEHRTDWVTTYPFMAFEPAARGIGGHPASKGEVRIGNDVWIGYGATILSGVTIGSGAVVGARALVSKDVAPYAIVAGNPARVVGYRFDEPVREALLEIAWWDWPRDKILEAAPLLLSDRIEEFVERFGPGGDAP